MQLLDYYDGVCADTGLQDSVEKLRSECVSLHAVTAFESSKKGDIKKTAKDLRAGARTSKGIRGVEKLCTWVFVTAAGHPFAVLLRQTRGAILENLYNMSAQQGADRKLCSTVQSIADRIAATFCQVYADEVGGSQDKRLEVGVQALEALLMPVSSSLVSTIHRAAASKWELAMSTCLDLGADRYGIASKIVMNAVDADGWSQRSGTGQSDYENVTVQPWRNAIAMLQKLSQASTPLQKQRVLGEWPSVFTRCKHWHTGTDRQTDR
jgi:hypothetical protein